MQLTEEIIPLEDKRKYYKFGKEFFFYDPSDRFDPIRESQVNFKFFSLNLPDKFSECFLSPQNITLYLLDYLKFLRKKSPDAKIEKETLRDYLIRWFLAKDKKEKEGIFGYLLKVSQSRNLSYVDEVLVTTFLIGQLGKIRDESLIQNKLEYISTFPAGDELNQLKFAMKLSRIFSHIKLEEWESALYSLNEFDSKEIFSPNVCYYSAQIKLNLQETNEAQQHLFDLLKFDSDRLNYAIDNYNLKAYDIFLHNSFTRKFFELAEGTLLFDTFSNLTISQREDINLLIGINKSLKIMQHAMYSEFKTEELETKIDFIRAIATKYANSKSYFFTSTIPSLQKKTIEIAGDILNNITTNYEDRIDNSLKRYDEKITSIKESLSRVENDKNEVLGKEEAKNQKLLQEFNEKMSSEINHYQELFNKYETQPDQASNSVLKNAFGYNIIFAIFVLLAGGFAEYSNNYLSDIGNLASFLSIVFSGGIKWGFISFILGSIISIFLFINSTYDRYSQKNNINQKINALNLEKERAKSVFNTKIEEKKKAIAERYEKAKIKLNDDLINLQEGRKEERQKLEENLAEEKNSYIEPLKEILT